MPVCQEVPFADLWASRLVVLKLRQAQEQQTSLCDDEMVLFCFNGNIAAGRRALKLLQLGVTAFVGVGSDPHAERVCRHAWPEAKPSIAFWRPVMADGGVARLSTHAPISLMDRRLDQIGASKHQTKSQKWERVEAHERDRRREKQKQLARDLERTSEPEGPRELAHFAPSAGVSIRRTSKRRILTERAKTTLPRCRVRFLLHKKKKKNASLEPGTSADACATSLVMVDVHTSIMNVVLAAVQALSVYMVEGAERFIEHFFRRRVRLRCDGEPALGSLAVRLKTMFLDLGLSEANAKTRHSGEPRRASRSNAGRSSQSHEVRL